MKVAIGSDHGGYELKEILKDYLILNNIEVVDCGCYSKERVDYPLFASKVCKEVQKDSDFGVLVCTTGIGMSIVANKYRNIKAALITNPECARLTRQHNNSNIICFGEKFISADCAKECLKIFIEEKFTYGRHEDRIKMIEEVEKNEWKTSSI